MVEEKSRIIEQRKKRLGVLALVTGGLLIVQLMLWQWVQVFTIESDGHNVSAEQVNEVKKKTAEIQQAFEKQKLILEQMITVVPRETRTLQIIQRLEGKAQEAGVSLKVESITDNVTVASRNDVLDEEQKNEGGIQPLAMELKSEGSPVNLLKYMALLENLRELSEITEVRLSAIPWTVSDSERY